MKKVITVNGTCLCGKVKVIANTLSTKFGVCHCEMCRKWTGGPLMSAFCGTDVIFEGEADIKIYQSSEWAERGFCQNCGSNLFYRIKENQQYHIPIGLFKIDTDIQFAHQVFIDKKPDFYEFSNQTTNMTEADVFAMYRPPVSK